MNTKTIFAILFMFLSCGTIFAQTDKKAIFHKADSLNDLGDAYTDKNNYSKALELYSQAAELTKDINGGYNEHYALYCENMGYAYYAKRDNKNALKYYLQALEINEKVLGKEHPDNENALEWVGYFYYQQKDYQQAAEYYSRKLKIDEKVYGKQSEDYASTLKNIGISYIYLKNYQKSLEYLLPALDIYAKSGNKGKSDYAHILNFIGTAYYRLGDNKNALKYMTQELEINEKLLGKEHPDYITSLNNIGKLYSTEGDYQNALKYYLECLKIREKTIGKNHPDYATTLDEVGKMYSYLHDSKNALNYHFQALEIRAKTPGKESEDYANSLNSIGYTYSNSGDYQNAMKYYMECLETREKVTGKEHTDYANLLNNISVVYKKNGDNKNALKYAQMAMETWKKVLANGHKNASTPTNYAASLNNIGSIYSDMGDHQKALEYLFESLEIVEKTGGKEHPNYAKALNNIATEYTHMGDYQNALKYLSEALEIMEKALGKNHPNYIALLNNFNILRNLMDDNHVSMESQLNALKNLEKKVGKEHPEYASMLVNIGTQYLLMGDFENALEYQLRGLKIQEKVLGKEHPDYAASLNFITPTYLFMFKTTEAMNTNKEATEINRRNLIRNFSFMTAQEREAYWNAYNSCFSMSILFSNLLSDDPIATKNSYDAELITKGLLLASEINTTNIIMESGNEALISEYKAMKDAHLQLNKELEKPIAERVLDCDSLENEIQKMERNIIENCKEFGDVTHFIRIDWKEVQKSLKQNDVAIEFANYTFEDSTKYVALVLTKDMEAPVCVPLFNNKELRKMIRGVAPAKSETPSNDENRGATSVSAKRQGIYESTELYRTLWKPLEKYFPENPRIYFAPSGMLHQIAIEYAPVGEGKLISDKYEIYRVSSTRFLAMDYMTKPMTNSVLYGGVYYDSDTTTMKQESERYSTRSATYNSFAEFNKGEDRGSLNYLLGTKTEVEDIVGKLKANNISTTLYEGSQASEESFKALSGSKISALHIATHGFFLPSDEILSGDQSLIQSGLLLSGANYAWQNLPIPDGVEDGILTAKEISFIDLRNTDLVVLSACQTALGEITGEGVFGLQRGFKKAGARTIIMSLWPVDDNATLLMMTEFYTNLTNGMSKREAFNVAQNKVKTTAGFENPRYWAAFIMLDGNEK
ncbi:MAG: CHAT domain-containing protein [Bacteroidales bacterium]|nr:CHAT domain-containing protein [Bacteroidales bacterium]